MSQRSLRGAKIRPKPVSDSEEEELKESPKKKEQLTILVSGKAKKDKKVVENLKRLGAKVIDDIENKFDVMVADDKLIRNCKLL